MKKDYTIRTQLGLTQEDIAMLLGVSRSRWSMFEIGKRDLPLPSPAITHRNVGLYQRSRNRKHQSAAGLTATDQENATRTFDKGNQLCKVLLNVPKITCVQCSARSPNLSGIASVV